VTLDQEIRQHKALARRVLFGVPPQDVILVQDAVRAVLDLHNEFRIYDDCGHTHTEAGNGVLDIENVGLTCKDGYEYSICRSCCADGGEYQTEVCASHERPCWPCPTHHAIATALGIDLSAVTG